MRSVLFGAAIAALCLLPGTVLAQEEDLVVVGAFDRAFHGTGSIGGFETYSVICDQAADECIDNDGNISLFAEPLAGVNEIRLCADDQEVAGAGAVPCVHEIEIVVRTSVSYVDAYVDLQRAGCELNEILYDGIKVAGNSDPWTLIGSTAGEEFEWVDVSFALGKLRKNKDYTLRISSPSDLAPDSCTEGLNTIAGIAIRATR
jgi:hypothetical protein